MKDETAHEGRHSDVLLQEETNMLSSKRKAEHSIRQIGTFIVHMNEALNKLNMIQISADG